MYMYTLSSTTFNPADLFDIKIADVNIILKRALRCDLGGK